MTEHASLLRPKKRFTFTDAYWVTVKAFRSLPDFIRYKRRLGDSFTERIMLAVTEVNGCPACAYEHAKIALRSGMDSVEIRQMLNGEYNEAPDGELPALMFAQHYADSQGNPAQDAWAAIEKEYGPNLARGILGAVRMMMWGNVIGIAYSGVQARLAGKPFKESSLPRDIAMMIFGVLNLPVAMVQAALSNMVRHPIVGDAEERVG